MRVLSSDVMLHDDVRQIRIERRLSQLGLSRIAGVPRSQLRIFEDGGNITLETLGKILAPLGLTLGLQRNDAAPLLSELQQVIASATRALEMFEAAPPAIAPAAGATRFEGGTEISPSLDRRLRELEQALLRGLTLRQQNA